MQHRLGVRGALLFVALGLPNLGFGAVDFDTQIIPVLTKAGCNAGACHGAAIGRGGFKLSLYGSDPALDYQSIVHELEGRRVNLADPESSLVLLKPTQSITHGGGTRFDLESPPAARLLKWLAAGAARTNSRKLSRLQIVPESRVLQQVGTTVPLKSVAYFDDGHTEDVTRWTVFKANDEAAVAIDVETAVATVRAAGPNVIIARFLDQVVPLTLTVPLRDKPIDLSAAPRQNFIDDHVLHRLGVLRIPVSPRADQATLVRRAYLDLTGALPPPAAVAAYQADQDDSKWSRLIEGLLESDAYVDYWTYQFAKLLRIRSQPKDTQGALTFHKWLGEQLRQGTRYDELARTLVTAEGDSHEYGPANFYRAVGGPREQAEYVSQVFMGVRLRCANCHNHPLDRWTQDDYHGLAALFAKIERGRIIKVGTRGDVTHPRTGNPATPKIPGDQFLDSQIDGRGRFADWLTRADNPFFARAVVNRVWKSLMGRGLVEPADDLRATNPATHPQLLDELATYFVQQGYDLRQLLRLIANSETYCRSTRSLPANRSDQQYYSHALVRPLEPEVLADALADVTSVPGKYGDEPAGTRAVTLFDPKIPSTALDILGRCSREETCETPAAAQASGIAGGLTTKLHLINGALINRKITAKNGRLHRLIAAEATEVEILTEFYLQALSRLPRESELAYWKLQFEPATQQSNRMELFEDLLWSLLTCREFVTNH